MNTIPQIFPVTCHTDQVGPGSIFVAIKGFSQDGMHYIRTALERGATTIVVEDTAAFDTALWQLIYKHRCIVQRVADARLALAQLSAKAAGYPAKKLHIIGVTGTKGKTTTVNLIFHMLQTAGISSALISSVRNAINDHTFKAPLTTPQPDYIHQFFKLCVDTNVTWVVMEVASHAITLHRIDGIMFDAVIITNIAREHLEFYHSFDEYAATKVSLLSYRKKNAIAWLNKDDERLAAIPAKNVHYFSLQQPADIQGIMVDDTALSMTGTICIPPQQYRIDCPTLFGIYNGSNIAAAWAAGSSVGIAPHVMQQAIHSFKGVLGRLETYQLPNGATIIIDCAHNPLSYEALFSTLRLRTHHLVVIFGAGGDRDQGRRPVMGALVAKYADRLFITTDNPRSEDPQKIVADILEGIRDQERHKIIIEPDREKAIKDAYAQSEKGTIIALIGKGQDEYQIIGKQKIPFNERAIIKTLIVQA